VSWFIHPLKGKYYGTVVDIGRGKVTVWLPLGEHYAASEREIAEGWEPDDGFDHVETQESYAAAKLIAATPDMLEALREVTDHFQAVMGGPIMRAAGVSFPNGIENIPTIAKARAAISKATT